MSYDYIRTETKGAVTIVTIDRPDALNALSSKVLGELIEAFRAFEADDSQHCAVVTGAGEKAFAAGADIKEMAAMDAVDFYKDEFFSGWNDELVGKTRKPWIAAVNGFALGGGCELAMMADFIIASDKAQFGQPEITLGVGPGMGGSQRLTRAVGKSKAMDMCLTGRRIDAEEAERSGLVARVVPHDQLMDEAMKAAEKIASMSPVATVAVKEMVNAAEQLPLAEGIRHERRLFQILAATEDKAEGMNAFIEKRDPAWKGR